MAKMWQLLHDGTVAQCDDTPDETDLGPKYGRAVNLGKGVFPFDGTSWLYMDHWRGDIRMYVTDAEVPNIIKLADALNQ